MSGCGTHLRSSKFPKCQVPDLSIAAKESNEHTKRKEYLHRTPTTPNTSKSTKVTAPNTSHKDQHRRHPSTTLNLFKSLDSRHSRNTSTQTQRNRTCLSNSHKHSKNKTASKNREGCFTIYMGEKPQTKDCLANHRLKSKTMVIQPNPEYNNLFGSPDVWAAINPTQSIEMLRTELTYSQQGKPKTSIPEGYLELSKQTFKKKNHKKNKKNNKPNPRDCPVQLQISCSKSIHSLPRHSDTRDELDAYKFSLLKKREEKLVSLQMKALYDRTNRLLDFYMGKYHSLTDENLRLKQELRLLS